MKMISKIANMALGLIFIASASFAQSLDDAKKAIDAEQYQKASGMLKNLANTKPDDEVYFYQGWVYLLQDYADSAKASFTKGLAENAKSALSYVGLGAVALQTNDATGATSNFNQAIQLTSRKDSKPYLYIGKAYLLGAKDGKFPPAKANAAIDALTKGKEVNSKDAEVMVALGNAYRSQLKSNEAYDAYQAALTLDPKSPTANVAIGVLWKYADNFDDSEKQFQAALAIDPNFGPAYRELAEMQKTQAQTNRKVASEKIKLAVENYKKYLSLTDESVESLLRYADFLVNAGDYETLQGVATKLSKSADVNARVYRYLGYAAYENKDYAAAKAALDSWFSKAAPDRILPRDYLYVGRIQIALGDTTKGIETLKKYADLDTTAVKDAYAEIIDIYKKRKDYLGIADSYQAIIDKVSGQPLSVERFYAGFYYYNEFVFNQVPAYRKNQLVKPDSTLLVKADTLLSQYERITKSLNGTPVIQAYSTRAYIADYKDTVITDLKGFAKPRYEKIIELFGGKATPSDTEKRILSDAYAYLGLYAQYHDKDEIKAEENFTKARELNPNNSQAVYYFDKKAAAAAPKGNPAAKKAGSK